MKTAISVSFDDIFDYVVGNSNFDPIEKRIDPSRYEVFVPNIYDHHTKTFLPQNEDFQYFSEQLSLLRKNARSISPKELEAISRQLFEVAPKEINLTED